MSRSRGSICALAYLHELLKSSTLKGLALVRGRVTRHDGLFALRDLVPEAWWCG